MKYLIIATFFAMLNMGCSDKKDVLNELNEKSEGKNIKEVLKTAVPSSSSDRGVKKIIPVLEESHDHCKGDNECFCQKSNFSGSVTIVNTKYHCR